MNSFIRWTYLKPREIVSEFFKKGYSIALSGKSLSEEEIKALLQIIE
jgi:hypothetical protein